MVITNRHEKINELLLLKGNREKTPEKKKGKDDEDLWNCYVLHKNFKEVN